MHDIKKIRANYDIFFKKIVERNSELDLQTQKVNESEETLEAKTEEVIEKAEDLDLDLSFLKDGQDSEITID